MKGASKVIMGATLAMVVSLAIVLGLILVLLAELYCSLLLRRRQQLRLTATATTAAESAAAAAAVNASSSPPYQQQSTSASPPPFAAFYSHGVIQAPRSLLFPLASGKENNAGEAAAADNKEKLKKLHLILDIQAQEHSLGGTTSPSSLSIANSTPVQIREIPSQISPDNECQEDGKACGLAREHFVYISNPIYDNDACRPSQVDTPFETPDSSPSRLEMGDSSSNSSSSGDEEEVVNKLRPSKSCKESFPDTPPLTPMKKLPKEACSVSLTDARSFGTSGSDSVGNNGLSSSSSSGSPCTSPSW